MRCPHSTDLGDAEDSSCLGRSAEALTSQMAQQQLGPGAQHGDLFETGLWGGPGTAVKWGNLERTQGTAGRCSSGTQPRSHFQPQMENVNISPDPPSCF